jgi:hypothetical protein
MKKAAIIFMSLVLVFAFLGMANAVPITFDEVPLVTTDPTIEGISFWAGNPAYFSDTYTDDSLTPGNPYLASGFNDGTTGITLGLNGSFIGISGIFNPLGTYFFDIASEVSLPPGTTLTAYAYAGANMVASSSLPVAYNDYAYYQMSLTSVGIFDNIYIFNPDNFSFHIDNFDYRPSNNPPVPEPATILLFCLGLLPIVAISRRRMGKV